MVVFRLPKSWLRLGLNLLQIDLCFSRKVMATATLKLLSCLPDKKESHSDSFLKNRDLPLNVLSFLQWNIHNECFLSCQETKLPGHCDASYPHCKENATEQLRSMLTEGNGALDFAGVEQMADEQLATNQVDVEWGQIYHTCGGENGFGAAPFDIAMLLYRKSKWEVKQVNGTFLQPFGGCMERADGGEGPTNYRAFLGQAFVHKHSRFEVLVVVAHFPHIKRYSEEILRLSAALTSFRASSGVNQARPGEAVASGVDSPKTLLICCPVACACSWLGWPATNC